MNPRKSANLVHPKHKRAVFFRVFSLQKNSSKNCQKNSQKTSFHTFNRELQTLTTDRSIVTKWVFARNCGENAFFRTFLRFYPKELKKTPKSAFLCDHVSRG